MDLVEVGVVEILPADSTVSLSLSVMRYQLKSSLLKTATIFFIFGEL